MLRLPHLEVRELVGTEKQRFKAWQIQILLTVELMLESLVLEMVAEIQIADTIWD
jgi:hypothetical protein